MAEQANVSSIEALGLFRSALIVFLARSRQALDETLEAVRRTRAWIDPEQRHFWEIQHRKRLKALDAAMQELFGAKITGQRESHTRLENNVRRAKQALAEAEEKMRAVKQWSRNYDQAVDPLSRRLEGLRHTLDFEMPKALAELVAMENALAAYAETRPDVPKPVKEEGA